MRSLRCRLFAGTLKVRSLPWLIFTCFTVQLQRFIAQMHQLYVDPLFCFSQVRCKEDQGETENQQSSVWRGLLFWGILMFFFFAPLMERFAQSFLSAPTCNSTIRQRPVGFLALFKFANPLAQPGITHSCPSFRSWLKEWHPKIISIFKSSLSWRQISLLVLRCTSTETALCCLQTYVNISRWWLNASRSVSHLFLCSVWIFRTFCKN